MPSLTALSCRFPPLSSIASYATHDTTIYLWVELWRGKGVNCIVINSVPFRPVHVETYRSASKTVHHTPPKRTGEISGCSGHLALLYTIPVQVPFSRYREIHNWATNASLATLLGSPVPWATKSITCSLEMGFQAFYKKLPRHPLLRHRCGRFHFPRSITSRGKQLLFIECHMSKSALDQRCGTTSAFIPLLIFVRRNLYILFYISLHN